MFSDFSLSAITAQGAIGRHTRCVHVTCCLNANTKRQRNSNDECHTPVMNFITPFNKHAKLVMLLTFILTIILTGIILRSKFKVQEKSKFHVQWNTNITTEPKKTRKEYLYRLLTNTTLSLIQMEIKARRLEENMRRIKERTADLLWKNKDKALWHILFKNISRHISIRHEFHQHSSLNRILQDSDHKRRFDKRRQLF